MTSAQEVILPETPVIFTLEANVSNPEFTYEGEEGQVIIVTYQLTQSYAGVKFGLVDPDGDVVISANGMNDSPTIVVLASSGTYTLTFSPEYSDTVGEATATLQLATELVLGEAITGTRKTSDKDYFYYSDESDFNLEYLQEGEASFDVSVNDYDLAFTDITRLINISGAKNLTPGGTISTITGDQLYIIILTDSFSYMSDENEATYTLTLTSVE